ncbi:MAG: antibiotic biosynthesis monooxygenase [Pseudomonadota bacterium]
MVTVLIKRKLVPDNQGKLTILYHKMHEAALAKGGYLGSEILKRTDAENQVLVISRWENIDKWTHWLVSAERMHLQDQIDAITSEDTKFEIYE